MVNVEETLIVMTADHSHAVTFNGYPERGNPLLGYIYKEPFDLSVYPDGSRYGYPTISYANGPGYWYHFVNEGVTPWRDMRYESKSTEDVTYQHPAMFPGPENYESHGGEDVGIFAIGENNE